MSASGYFMKSVNDCKDVSIISPQGPMKTDKFTLFAYCNFLVLLSTTVCSKNLNKQNGNLADETQITAFSVGITLLNQRIIYKDDIEFVTEFPCLLGPLYNIKLRLR